MAEDHKSDNGVDLLDIYKEMIHEPKHPPKLAALIEDVKRQGWDVRPSVSGAGLTVADIVTNEDLARDETFSAWTERLYGATVRSEDIVSGGTISASALYGETDRIVARGIGAVRGPDMGVTAEGALYTVDAQGNEVVRIDRDGIHIGGNLILTNQYTRVFPAMQVHVEIPEERRPPIDYAARRAARAQAQEEGGRRGLIRRLFGAAPRAGG